MFCNCLLYHIFILGPIKVQKKIHFTIQVEQFQTISDTQQRNSKSGWNVGTREAYETLVRIPSNSPGVWTSTLVREEARSDIDWVLVSSRYAGARFTLPSQRRLSSCAAGVRADAVIGARTIVGELESERELDEVELIWSKSEAALSSSLVQLGEVGCHRKVESPQSLRLADLTREEVACGREEADAVAGNVTFCISDGLLRGLGSLSAGGGPGSA